MIDSFSNHVFKGIIWSAVERLSVQGMQFVLNLVIARFVLPSDYGLMAMLSLFLAIAQVFVDGGFSNALIQNKKSTEIDFSTIFYFNIFISFFAYLILFYMAPLIASFYNEPLLEKICRVSSLSIVISSLSIIHRTKIAINIDYKLQAKISFISVFFSGLLGVYLACTDYGVWSLVIQNLIYNLINMLLIWMKISWKPIWVFSISSIKKLSFFGLKILLGSILGIICDNIYNLMIGKRYNSTNVGYFTQSYAIAMFPSNAIGNIVYRVAFTILCKVQNENSSELNSVLLKFISITAYILFPLIVGIAVLSKSLIICVLGERWSVVSDLVTIMCIASIWHPISYFNWQILQVKGRSDLSLKTEVIKRILQLIILLITISYGINIVAFGMIVYFILEFIIILYYVKYVYDIKYLQVLKSIYPALYLSFIMGICIYIFTFFIANYFFKIICGVIVGVLVYVCFSEMTKNKCYLILKKRINEF